MQPTHEYKTTIDGQEVTVKVYPYVQSWQQERPFRHASLGHVMANKLLIQIGSND
jgi:hypothetical protein